MGGNAYDKARNSEYIHRFARTVAGQVGIKESRCVLTPRLAPDIYAHCGDQLRRMLGTFSPQTRGRIADCGTNIDELGRCTLNSVHLNRSNWLDHFERTGRSLVTEIAVTTIVAAMVDNIRADQRKRVIAEASTEEDSDEPEGISEPEEYVSGLYDCSDLVPGFKGVLIMDGDGAYEPGHLMATPHLEVYDAVEEFADA